MEEAFSAKADGGFDRVGMSAECDGDVRCGATVTAVTPAKKAGVQQDPEGVDDVGASAGADDDCGAAEVLRSEKFWADVGGSSPDPTCIRGGEAEMALIGVVWRRSARWAQRNRYKVLMAALGRPQRDADFFKFAGEIKCGDLAQLLPVRHVVVEVPCSVLGVCSIRAGRATGVHELPLIAPRVRYWYNQQKSGLWRETVAKRSRVGSAAP